MRRRLPVWLSTLRLPETFKRLGLSCRGSRAQTERVEFDFDASASVTEQAEAVLQAIADGKVAPDVGKQILDGISTLYGIKQIAELEARLQALEDNQ